MESVQKIFDVLRLAERLKFELRHSWLSNGRQESVAEHTYQMALMAVFAAPYLEHPVDLECALRMVLVHDLVEALTGDIPFFEAGDREAEKARREREAIEKIRNLLPEPLGGEVFEWWCEFETGETVEAKFVRALDHLEVQFQHNLASFDTWQPIEHELVYTKVDRWCAHDSFLSGLCSAIKTDAEEKMRAAGVDVEALKSKLGVRER